jgi:hypothetical protein
MILCRKLEDHTICHDDFQSVRADSVDSKIPNVAFLKPRPETFEATNLAFTMAGDCHAQSRIDI